MDSDFYSSLSNNFFNNVSDGLDRAIAQLPVGSWIFWIFVLFFILFLLWLFFGGEEHEYVGLAPMKIGVDSTKYISGQAYAEIEKSNVRAETKEIKNNFEPSQVNRDTSKTIKKVSKGEEICRNIMKELYNKDFHVLDPIFLKILKLKEISN